MAASKQQYWPSLYDRLTKGDAKGIDDHFVDGDALRDNVRRDLQALLNTTSLEASTDLTGYDRVRASVLNYGIVDLPGQIVDGILEWKLRDQLAEAIRNFEPRIASDSIAIEVQTETETHTPDAIVRIVPDHGVTIAIAGKVHCLGRNEMYLRIETKLDVAKGSTEVSVT